MSNSIENFLIRNYTVSTVKNETIRIFFLDLELVKAVQPNFLMVFAKKLPLKPHPKTKNLFVFLSELAEFFMLYYSSTYVLLKWWRRSLNLFWNRKISAQAKVICILLGEKKKLVYLILNSTKSYLFFSFHCLQF